MLGNVEHHTHNLRVCLECPGIKEVFEEKLIVILKVNAKIIDSCYCTVPVVPHKAVAEVSE